MNSKTKLRELVFSSAISALIGCVAGYMLCAFISSPQQEQPAIEISPIRTAHSNPKQNTHSSPGKLANEPLDTNSETEVLRKHIGELEAQLAKLKQMPKSQPAKITSTATSVATAPENSSHRKESFFERMERMKAEEPEKYKEITDRRQDFKKRMHSREAVRLEFFQSMDTSVMTEEQKANHQKLLEAIAICDEATDYMGLDAKEPLTAEENKRLFEHMRALGPLMKSERRYILEEIGKAYGEDGAVFADYIQKVLEETSMNGPGPAN